MKQGNIDETIPQGWKSNQQKNGNLTERWISIMPKSNGTVKLMKLFHQDGKGTSRRLDNE